MIICYLNVYLVLLSILTEKLDCRPLNIGSLFSTAAKTEDIGRIGLDSKSVSSLGKVGTTLDDAGKGLSVAKNIDDPAKVAVNLPGGATRPPKFIGKKPQTLASIPENGELVDTISQASKPNEDALKAILGDLSPEDAAQMMKKYDDAKVDPLLKPTTSPKVESLNKNPTEVLDKTKNNPVDPVADKLSNIDKLTPDEISKLANQKLGPNPARGTFWREIDPVAELPKFKPMPKTPNIPTKIMHGIASKLRSLMHNSGSMFKALLGAVDL
ncbi:expressed protein [Phakopsora pachyrhizi]|uniref:Expressed protein n=1 Tax=Phakopsora pachyrhizi TaxID=170000 RepID=A0AAV0BPX3_PHAPC|nr:expressed protein [Phakopsora pachyrhizi]